MLTCSDRSGEKLLTTLGFIDQCPVILDAIKHYHIEFELDDPIQNKEPHNIRCSSNEKHNKYGNLQTSLQRVTGTNTQITW